jgi:hypothetical protein
VLRLPDEAISPILDEVCAYGARRKETGGFLLSAIDEPERVVVVALAGTVGITRWWGQFGISGGALDRLFTWADEHDLRIAAQFHSHGGRAFLSPTDLAHGLNVRGFVTCVIPSFKAPPREVERWGWWKFDGRTWKPEPPPTTANGTVTTVTFDERGVGE